MRREAEMMSRTVEVVLVKFKGSQRGVYSLLDRLRRMDGLEIRVTGKRKFPDNFVLFTLVILHTEPREAAERL